MTREEAIRIFRKEIECLSHTKCEDCILEKACDPMNTTPYDSEYIEAYSMAIKALEQEPMVEIDLYSVIKQKYIEREVLDKIRAEIDNALSDGMVHKKTVIGIIDKYKADIEPQADKEQTDDLQMDSPRRNA